MITNKIPTSSVHQEDQDNGWVHLQDTKSFSRILYTNPVCFLSTTVNLHKQETDSIVVGRNVMVVSWLTATNNTGRFMMSLNKRRHTASVLTNFAKEGDNNSTSNNNNYIHNDNARSDDDTHQQEETEFVLSVPVQGMEDLVLNVGKTSGRWKSSKFPLDHHHHYRDDEIRSTDDKPAKKRQMFQRGIDGLAAVRLGCSDQAPEKENDLFAIQGTVAHLHCRIYRIVDGVDGNAIDDDHHLILAEVVDAHVHQDYWNAKKKQFRPRTTRGNVENDDDDERVILGHENSMDDGQPDHRRRPPPPPPYMTFFGSQSFGYVVPG